LCVLEECRNSSGPFVINFHFFDATPIKRCVSPYLEFDNLASFTFPKAGLKAKASPVISASIEFTSLKSNNYMLHLQINHYQNFLHF
jgi:hypothetical protein